MCVHQHYQNLVATDIESDKTFQAENLCWYPLQVVVGKRECLEVGQFAVLDWYGCKLVLTGIQALQRCATAYVTV